MEALQFALALIHELVKFIGLLLIGQGIVYAMSLGRHETNAVYKGMRFLTSPVTKAVRVITPRSIMDRHVPVVAFFLTFWAWIALIFIRAQMGPPGGS